MKSTIKTVVKPTNLGGGSAIHFYSADASRNTGCTRDFQCALLSFKSYFLNRTTISKKTNYFKFFPGPYQHIRAETIKKVSSHFTQKVELRII